MDSIQDNQRSILLISIGIVLGTICALFLLVGLINWDLDGGKIVTALTGIAMLVVAIVTITFTYQSNKNQRQQWLDDAFIKYESDKLLELRQMLGEALSSYHFFSREILTPKMYGYIPASAPILKRELVVENFNNLLRLNNLYNEHQHIYRKHGLDKHMQYFTFFLDVGRLLPDKDLGYTKVSQTNQHSTYLLEGWLDIYRTFVMVASHTIDYAEKGIIPDIDTLNADLNKDVLQEKERLLNIIAQKVIELTFMLDRLTIHNYEEYADNLGVRQHKFYQPLTLQSKTTPKRITLTDRMNAKFSQSSKAK